MILVHLLFNKFKINLFQNVNAYNTVGKPKVSMDLLFLYITNTTLCPPNVNTYNTVGQPSRANADPISDPSGIE
ncbi:hypothetical protein BCR32DRAFT_279351 [Anaeromyces robustus]|uniref:Uncharacterized protein n=1 Tax=Anaeromyces robustus TaxID=1754192 RepID=A0A1Y1X802_9FUNG|nr:hypothetical protein BCR32DRAFT_279351 [Anaeromyces robustus]|eukprot:ORX81890.1 hypothetical protein BCR32DRAFT_279351 [Anaeromyces robustus]